MITLQNPKENINVEQHRAANPLSSVWVSASAGSGKTKVLTDRVLNLLLLYGQPEKILCLTFTKTAAAEMANRITRTLQQWGISEEKKLSQDLATLLRKEPTPEEIQKARRLFATVLETPGGLKIMTIHSFCQSVLKRFPLEAGISPHFDIMDDQLSDTVIQKTIETTLLKPEFQQDLSLIAGYLDEDTLKEIFEGLLKNPSPLKELQNRFPTEDIYFNIKKNFNIEKYHSENEIILENFSLEEFPDLITQNLTQKLIIQARVKDPEKASLVFKTVETIKNYRVATATIALIKIAYDMIKEYRFYKDQHALMDYNDLILNTKSLLEKSTMVPWVLYKLDGGVDHILVDESQDTNPSQWAIIRMLAEEFFMDESSFSNRTLFAVGDKKQSIFSFQGADPNEFERMRLFFQEKVLAARKSFETVPFNLSFRSVQPILDLVNYLLVNPIAKQGVLQETEQAPHFAFRDQDAGLVEIWPLEEAEKTDEADPWKPPVDPKTTTSAITRLAERIAKKIKTMIDSKEILISKNRPIQPNDILILVQRRGKFVTEMIRVLKEYNIPVAGIDRLVLTNHIAIQDLIAAARFVLLPSDDLNLATLLKSPLIGLTDEDLFKIAWNRGEHSLWDKLQIVFPDKTAYLRQLLSVADQIPVYDFFALILGPFRGREYFKNRLGEEVDDVLDEFLALTLSYEKDQTPSLEGFVRWFLDKKIEIKRDADQSALNVVRIMTVHASKGLQGNIVFLPETRYVPQKKEKMIWTSDGFPVWIPRAAHTSQFSNQFYDHLEKAKTEEYHRLLYVALTRASDRLYICGWENKTKAKQGNWYDLIINSIPYKPDPDGVIRISSTQLSDPKNSKESAESPSIPPLPAFIFQTPHPEEMRPHPISPSKQTTEEKDQTASILTPDLAYALRRGQFIHKLLQYLPEIPPQDRLKVAHRLKPEDISIPENLFNLFENPDFQELFSNQSIAEVPIVGTIDNQLVSGQIDRLVVLENEVLIIDFKTNRRVPTSPDKVPLIYKNQMDTYKRLIKNIFPDKIVRTFLLWTETLVFMELK